MTIPEILSHYSALGYSAGDVALDRHRLGRRRLQPRRRVALPQARRRDRGRDRADRRAAQPGRLVAGGARRAGAAPRPLVSWPRDDAKLDRVRALMAEQRARRARRPRARQRPLPDELLGHEGLRRLRLPARGRAGAALPRGLGRGRRAHGVDGRRALRPRLRRDRPAAAARAHARRSRSRRRASTAASALELSLGTQASDRMVGEPTTFTNGWFDAWPGRGRRDAAARGRARAQDRRRRSSGSGSRTRSARRRWSTCARELRPGMKESEAAAIWQGFVHGEGTGWRGTGRARARLLARLVGRGDQDVHRDRRPAGVAPTSRRCSRSGSAPTATGATTRSSSARASCAPTTASSRRRCSRSTARAIDHCRPGASLAELDRLVRDGHRRGRLSGPAVAPDLPRRRRARARAAVRPPGRRREVAEGMVLAIEPGCYWEGGGGLRVEDNFLITRGGRREALVVPRRRRAGVTERVCVAGAGVIGSLFAGHLAQVADVSVLTRREEHARALNERGPARLGPLRPPRARHRVDRPDGAPGARSRARVLQGHRPRADSPTASRATSPGATMMTVQNGLGADEIVGRARRLADPLLGHVHERHAPLRHARRVHPRHRDVDRPDPGHDAAPTPSAVAELIRSSGLKAEAFDDLRPAQWSKLIFNATVNAVAALTGLPHEPRFAAARRARRPRPPRAAP